MLSRDEIIKCLVANSAEIITEDEFRERLSASWGTGETLTHYIGFEISGYVHIGQGIMSALVMKDLTDLGVKCTVWLADWHTAINEKLDGTKETAAKIGKGYFTEAIKACFAAVGGNPGDLEFRLASEWYAKDLAKYWDMVLAVMRNTTQARLGRSITIMGREEKGEIAGDKLVYPAMQAADVFYQQIDIAHAGTDQRKAYVIMRDVAGALAPNRPKPVVLLHHLLPALDSPEGKMSKSKPGTAIFVHDSPGEIEAKITKAFCPEKETEKNPVLAWTKHLLFWSASRRTAQPFKIERKAEHGGDVEFATYEELEKAYAAGDVHPMDLKAAVTRELTDLLAPVREHFAKPDVAAEKEELDDILSNR